MIFPQENTEKSEKTVIKHFRRENHQYFSGTVMMMSEIKGNKEKWIKHYSSGHNILLVGEGDFSFSLCLGMTFGSANNIVATSLDSYGILSFLSSSYFFFFTSSFSI